MASAFLCAPTDKMILVLGNANSISPPSMGKIALNIVKAVASAAGDLEGTAGLHRKGSVAAQKQVFPSVGPVETGVGVALRRVVGGFLVQRGSWYSGCTIDQNRQFVAVIRGDSSDDEGFGGGGEQGDGSLLYRAVESLVGVAAVADAGAEVRLCGKDGLGGEANRQNDGGEAKEGFVIGHGFS